MNIDLTGKNVLVTGDAGFIDSNICVVKSVLECKTQGVL